MHGVGHGWGAGESLKAHPENDHHLSQDEEKGLYRYVGTLSPNQANVTNRRIRDPYVRWCERRTVSILLTAVYSIKYLTVLLLVYVKYDIFNHAKKR